MSIETPFHFAIQEGHIRPVDNVKVKRSNIVDVAKRAIEMEKRGEGISFEHLYHIRQAFKSRYKRSPLLRFFHRLFGSGKQIEQKLSVQLAERVQQASELAKKGELSYEEGKDILHTLVNDHPVFKRLTARKKENVSTFLTVRLLNEREEFSAVIQDLARGNLSSFLDYCHSCQNVLEDIQEVLADNAILSAYGLQDEQMLISIQGTPCEPLVRLFKRETYGEGELAETLKSFRKRERILEQKYTRWKEIRESLSGLFEESASLSYPELKAKAEEVERNVEIPIPPFNENTFLESLVSFQRQVASKLALSPLEALERRCMALLSAKARLHTKKSMKSNVAREAVQRRFHCSLQPGQFDKYEITEGAVPELSLLSHIVLRQKEDQSLLVLVQSEVGEPPFYSYSYKEGVLLPQEAQDRTARLFLALHMLREDPVHAAYLLTPSALLPSIAPAKKEEKKKGEEEVVIQEKNWTSEEIELLQRIVWFDRPHRISTADSAATQLRALHVLSQLNKYLPQPDESIASMVSSDHVMGLLEYLAQKKERSVSLEPYEIDELQRLLPEKEKEKYRALFEELKSALRPVLAEKKKIVPEAAVQQEEGKAAPVLGEPQQKALEAIEGTFGRLSEPTVAASQQKPEREEQVQKEYALLKNACVDYTRRPKKAQEPEDAYTGVLTSIRSLQSQPLALLTSGSFDEVLHEIGEIREESQKEYEGARLRLIAYCTKSRKGISATRMHIPSDEQLFILYAQKNLRALQQMNPQLEEKDITKIEVTLRELLDAKQKMQKAGRVTSEIETLKRKLGKKDELPTLFENVLSMAEAKRAYEPEVYPHFQVYEVLTDLYIRPGQVTNLDRIITSDQNILLQMLMGGGKTDILLPLIALTKANGENISSVIVPSANLTEVWLKVQERLGVGFQQLAFLLPELSPSPTLQELSHIEEMLRMVQTGRGCLLYSPDRKHVLMNAYISLWEQKCRSGEREADLDKKIQTLSRILRMFYEKESVIGDEIDAVLKTNLQYIISLGEPERFSAREAKLVGNLLLFLKNNPPPVLLDFLTREEAVREGAETGAHIPHLSDALYDQEVLPRLVEESLSTFSPQENDVIRDSYGLIYIYLTRRYARQGDDPPSAAVMRCIEQLPKEMRTRLVLLRQTLLYILPKTLDSHFNAKEGYGVLDSQETPWAIPFEGPGAPAKTQFSTPQEQVARTIQAYIKHGVPLGYLRKILSDPQQAELCRSVFHEEKDPERVRRQLWESETLFRRFLDVFIYPSVQFHRRSIESNSAKLVASSHDISGFSGTITSFPGTSIFEEVYPDLDEETRSFFTLCTKKEKGEISVQSIGEHQPLTGTSGNAGRLLRMIKESSDQLALIDCAGWLRGTNIIEFARNILAARTDLDVVVFLNEKGEKMALIRGQTEPQSFEGLKVEPNKRFTIYDQLHTVGINIPQDKGAACLMTLGKEMIQRDYQQGLFRMRKILEAQKARLVYDDEALDALRGTIELEEGTAPDYLDWMRFFITKQTMKRLHENYQSMKQRMECRLENRLLRGIVQLSCDEDLTRAQALFRSSTSSHFFIKEKPIDPWDELGTIPEQISKEERVKKDISSQKASFQKAAHGFERELGQVEESSLEQELGKEVHLDDLPAHLDSHDHLGTDTQRVDLHEAREETSVRQEQAPAAALSQPAVTQQARVERRERTDTQTHARQMEKLDRLVRGTIQMTEELFAKDGRLAEQFQYRLHELKEAQRRALSAFSQGEHISSAKLFEQFVRPEMETLDRLGSMLERDVRMILFSQDLLERLPKAAQEHFFPMLLDAIRSQNPEYIDEAFFQVFQHMSLEKCLDVQREPLAPFPRSQRALIDLQRAASHPAVQAEVKTLQGVEAVLPEIKEDRHFLGIKELLRSGDAVRVHEEMERFLHDHIATLSLQAVEKAMQEWHDHSESHFVLEELTTRHRFLETEKRKKETEQLSREISDLADEVKEGEVERREDLLRLQARCQGALKPEEQTSLRQELHQLGQQHEEHEREVEKSSRDLRALQLPEAGSFRSALGRSAAEAAAAELRRAREHLLQEAQKGVLPDVHAFSQKGEEEASLLQEIEREGVRREELLGVERKVSQALEQGCRKEKEKYEAARLSLQSASLPEEREGFAKILRERNDQLLEKEKALNEAAKKEVGAALQRAHEQSSSEVQARLSNQMERLSSAQRDEKISFEEMERRASLLNEEREKAEALHTQCQAFLRSIEEHKRGSGISTQTLYRHAEKRTKGILQALQKEASDLSDLQKGLGILQEEVEQASSVQEIDRLSEEVAARKAEGSLPVIEQFEQAVQTLRETLEHTPLGQWQRVLSEKKEHLSALHEETLFQADLEKMKRAMQAEEGLEAVVALLAPLHERVIRSVERKQVVEGIVQDFWRKLSPSSLRESTLSSQAQEQLLSVSERNKEEVTREVQTTLLLLQQASDALRVTEESYASFQSTLASLTTLEASFDASVVEQYRSTRAAKQQILKTASREADFRSAMEALSSDLSIFQTAVQSQYEKILERKEKTLLESDESRALGTLFQAKPSLHSFFEAVERVKREYSDIDSSLANHRKKLEKSDEWKAAKEEYDQALDRTLTELSLQDIALALQQIATRSLSPRGVVLKQLLEERRDFLLRESHTETLAELRAMETEAHERLQRLNPLIRQAAIYSLQALQDEASIPQVLLQDIHQAPSKASIASSLQQKRQAAQALLERIKTVEALHENLSSLFSWPLLQTLGISWEQVLEGASKGSTALHSMVDQAIASHLPRSTSREELARFSLTEKLKEAFPVSYQKLSEELREREVLLNSVEDSLLLFVDTAPEEVARREAVHELKRTLEGKTDEAKRGEIRKTLARLAEDHDTYVREKEKCQTELHILQESLRGKQHTGAEALAHEAAERIGQDDILSIRSQIETIKSLKRSYEQLAKIQEQFLGVAASQGKTAQSRSELFKSTLEAKLREAKAALDRKKTINTSALEREVDMLERSLGVMERKTKEVEALVQESLSLMEALYEKTSSYNLYDAAFRGAQQGRRMLEEVLKTTPTTALELEAHIDRLTRLSSSYGEQKTLVSRLQQEYVSSVVGSDMAVLQSALEKQEQAKKGLFGRFISWIGDGMAQRTLRQLLTSGQKEQYERALQEKMASLTSLPLLTEMADKKDISEALRRMAHDRGELVQALSLEGVSSEVQSLVSEEKAHLIDSLKDPHSAFSEVLAGHIRSFHEKVVSAQRLFERAEQDKNEWIQKSKEGRAFHTLLCERASLEAEETKKSVSSASSKEEIDALYDTLMRSHQKTAEVLVDVDQLDSLFQSICEKSEQQSERLNEMRASFRSLQEGIQRRLSSSHPSGLSSFQEDVASLKVKVAEYEKEYEEVGFSEEIRKFNQTLQGLKKEQIAEVCTLASQVEAKTREDRKRKEDLQKVLREWWNGICLPLFREGPFAQSLSLALQTVETGNVEEKKQELFAGLHAFDRAALSLAEGEEELVKGESIETIVTSSDQRIHALRTEHDVVRERLLHAGERSSFLACVSEIEEFIPRIASLVQELNTHVQEEAERSLNEESGTESFLSSLPDHLRLQTAHSSLQRAKHVFQQAMNEQKQAPTAQGMREALRMKSEWSSVKKEWDGILEQEIANLTTKEVENGLRAVEGTAGTLRSQLESRQEVLRQESLKREFDQTLRAGEEALTQFEGVPEFLRKAFVERADSLSSEKATLTSHSLHIAEKTQESSLREEIAAFQQAAQSLAEDAATLQALHRALSLSQNLIQAIPVEVWKQALDKKALDHSLALSLQQCPRMVVVQHSLDHLEEFPETKAVFEQEKARYEDMQEDEHSLQSVSLLFDSFQKQVDAFVHSLHQKFEDRQPTHHVMEEAQALFQREASTLSSVVELEQACSLLQKKDPLGLLSSFQQELERRKEIGALQEKVDSLLSQVKDQREAENKHALKELKRELQEHPTPSRVEALHTTFKRLEGLHVEYEKEKEALAHDLEAFQGTLPQGVGLHIQKAKRELAAEGTDSLKSIRQEIDKAKEVQSSYHAFHLLERRELTAETSLAHQLCVMRNRLFQERYRAMEEKLGRGESLLSTELQKLTEDFASAETLVKTLQAEERRSETLLQSTPEQARSLFAKETVAYQAYHEACSSASQRFLTLQSMKTLSDNVEEQESFVHKFQEACTRVETAQQEVLEKRSQYIEDSFSQDLEALGLPKETYPSLDVAEASHKARVETSLLSHMSQTTLEAIAKQAGITTFLRGLAEGRAGCLSALNAVVLPTSLQARMGERKIALEQELQKNAFTASLLEQAQSFQREAEEAQSLLKDMETTRRSLQEKKEGALPGSFEQQLYAKAHEELETMFRSCEQKENSLTSLRAIHQVLQSDLSSTHTLLQQVERESQALAEEGAKSQSTEMRRIVEEGRGRLQKLRDDLPTMALAQWEATLEPQVRDLHAFLEASKKQLLVERYQKIVAEIEERMQWADETLGKISTIFQGSISKSLQRLKRKTVLSERVKRAIVDAPDTMGEAIGQIEADSKEYARKVQEFFAFDETLKGVFARELLALVPAQSWESILVNLTSADTVLASLLSRFSRIEEREIIASQTLSERLHQSFPLCHAAIAEEVNQLRTFISNKEKSALVRSLGSKFETAAQEAEERLSTAFELRQDMGAALSQLKSKCESLLTSLTLAELEAAAKKLEQHDPLELKASYLEELQGRKSFQRLLEKRRDALQDTSPEESARKSAFLSLLSDLSGSSTHESRMQQQQKSDRLWSEHEEYLQAKERLVQDLSHAKALVQEKPDFTHVHSLLKTIEEGLSSLGLEAIRERLEKAEEFRKQYQALLDEKRKIPARESFRSEYGKKAAGIYSDRFESQFQSLKRSLDHGERIDVMPFGRGVEEGASTLLAMDSLGDEIEKALTQEESSDSILGKKGAFYEQFDQAVTSFHEAKSRVQAKVDPSRDVSQHRSDIEQLRAFLAHFHAAAEETKAKRLAYIDSTVREVMDLLQTEASSRPQTDTLQACELALTRMIDAEVVKKKDPVLLETIAQDERAVDYLKNQAALRARCLRLIDHEGDAILPQRLLEQKSTLLQELNTHPASQVLEERLNTFRKESEEVKLFLREYVTTKESLSNLIQRAGKGSFRRCLLDRADQDLALLEKNVREGTSPALLAKEKVAPLLSCVRQHETQAVAVDALRISIEQLPGEPSQEVLGFLSEFHQALEGLQKTLSKMPLGEWENSPLYTQFQDMKVRKEEIIFKAYLDELQIVMDSIGAEGADQSRAEAIFQKTASLLAQPGGDGQQLARVRAFVEKWWKERSKSFHEVVRQGSYAGDISAKITALTSESIRGFYVELRDGYNRLHEASGTLKLADRKKAEFQEVKEAIEARREALEFVFPETNVQARYEELVGRLRQEKGASFVQATADLEEWREEVDPAIQSLKQAVQTHIQKKAKESTLSQDTFVLLQLLYSSQPQAAALQTRYQDTIQAKGSALEGTTLSEQLEHSIDWIAKEKTLMELGSSLLNACDATVTSIEKLNREEWASMPSLQEKAQELEVDIATWKKATASPQQKARAYQSITSWKATMEKMAAFQRETDRIYEAYIQRHLIGLAKPVADAVRSAWDEVIREKNKTERSRSASEVLAHLEVEKPFVRNVFDALDGFRSLSSTLNRYASLPHFQDAQASFQEQREKIEGVQNDLAGELIEKIHSLQSRRPVVANQAMRSRARHLMTDVFPKLFERLDIAGACQTSELSAKLISLLKQGGMEGLSFTGFCQAAQSIQEIRTRVTEGPAITQEVNGLCNELEVALSQQTKGHLYSEKIHDISMTLSSLNTEQRQAINRMLQAEKAMETWALEQTGHNAEEVQANRFSFRAYLMHESGLRRTFALTAQRCMRDVESKTSEHIADIQASMKHTLKQRFASLHLSGKLIEIRNKYLAAIESDFHQPLSVDGFQRKYDHWVRMHELLLQKREGQ